MKNKEKYMSLLNSGKEAPVTNANQPPRDKQY